MAATILFGQNTAADSLFLILADKSGQQSIRTNRLYERLIHMPAPDRAVVLQQITACFRSGNKMAAARSRMLFARLQPTTACPAPVAMADTATQMALRLQDPLLLADCYFVLGEAYNRCGPNEKAVIFLRKSLELRQKNPAAFTDTGPLLFMLATVLHRMQAYGVSNSYALGAFAQKGSLSAALQYKVVNLAGLNYHRKEQYDSAQYWFREALYMARMAADTAWVAIISGNMGHLLLTMGKYPEALKLMQLDYHTSLQTNDSPNAGNTLQRIAHIYQWQGKTDSALLLARQAYALVSTGKPYYNPRYPMMAALTLSALLEQKGAYRDAHHYYKIYHRIADSLSTVLNSSRLDVVEWQLQMEKDALTLQALQLEGQVEKQRRKWLLAGMGLVLLLVWALYTRKMQQQKAAAALLEEQKKLAEAEKAAAQEQLRMYTGHMLEKQAWLQPPPMVPDAQAIDPDTLAMQTILTEEDWRKFRTMFEKAYPGFLEKIKQQAADTTPAELRTAALIKLGVGNKHLASMLGISVDTVRKSKSRLRQRLQLDAQVVLEDYIASM